MDIYDSRAAVDVMAALQERIRELEQGNAKLRKEAIKLHEEANRDENEMSEREAQLIAASDKAKKMLEGASATLIELRRVRKENKALQKQINDLNQELSRKYESDVRAKVNAKQMIAKQKNVERLISEYEDLLIDILSPPESIIKLEGNVPFNSTTASVCSYSLPATLQHTVQCLQTLPYPFRDQKLDRKREIVQILMNARDIASRIADEIENLLTQQKTVCNTKRIQSEINVKAAHLRLLIQGMNRFRFE